MDRGMAGRGKVYVYSGDDCEEWVEGWITIETGWVFVSEEGKVCAYPREAVRWVVFT